MQITDQRDGIPRESVADPEIGEAALTMWASQFGDEYLERNQVDWTDRVPLLRRLAEQTGARSFLDVGCNAGWNLHALRAINPDFAMSGVDVNHRALQAAAAAGFDVVNARADSVAELFSPGSADMVITSGVLIHIPTEQLIAVMEAIRDASAGYVLAIEYAASREEAVEYRGQRDRLWRRPYGELYQSLGLSLLEFGQADGYNDCTYWLLEKAS